MLRSVHPLQTILPSTYALKHTCAAMLNHDRHDRDAALVGQGQASCLLYGPVVLGGLLCAPAHAVSLHQPCYHSTLAR